MNGKQTLIFLTAAGLVATGLCTELGGPPVSTPTLSVEIAPGPILAIMRKAADWQLAQTPAHRADEWTSAALYTGMMALNGVCGDAKYHDAMIEMGKKLEWKPGRRIYDADDHCVCQTYLELYLHDKDPAMLAPTQERFDYILAHRATNDLHFTSKNARNRWAWCDSLFMGPPAWVRLSAATGEKKYLDFADQEWWDTSEFLYDKQEHLFFRDSTYFDKREANGKKVFWSRGNGWVLAGLARVLQVMPREYSTRKRYEQQFQEMAGKISSLQMPDGLWRASLLDPDSYSLKETSGSGFYTFAIAWGINQGLLPRVAYEPIARKGWQALTECVTAEGKLEHVQPVGADPRKFDPAHSDVFGVGAFLLAGSEMYRLSSK